MKTKTIFKGVALMAISAHAQAGIGDWFASKVEYEAAKTVRTTVNQTITGSTRGSVVVPGAYVVEAGQIRSTGNASQDNCNLLQADLNNTMNQAVNSRMPRNTPGHYINDVYRVNDAMSEKIDVSGLFGGGFSLGSLFDKISNDFLRVAVNSGQGYINSQVRGMASEFGGSFSGFNPLSGSSGGSLYTAPRTSGSYGGTQTTQTAPKSIYDYVPVQQDPVAKPSQQFYSR